MELLNKMRKNGSTKRIATWAFIYLSFFQFLWAVGEESNTFSSGMDDTTTYKEPSTYITLTPLLSEVPTTSSAISQTISTTLESSTSPAVSPTISTTLEPSTSEMLNTTMYSTSVTYNPTTAETDLSCHAQTEFIASGPKYGDKKVPSGDDNFFLACPSIEVPIDSQNIGCFFISTNGYVTNGNLLPYAPQKDEIETDKITLMPLWTDIDTRNKGKVYYQIVDVYDKNAGNNRHIQTNLDAIINFFARFGQTNFNPTWALKVTWHKVEPFEGTGTETMTFQLILATDGAVTNMAYLYDDCQSSWMTTRTAIMGYHTPVDSYYHRDSMSSDIFKLGLKGNTQNETKGVWTFELSKQYTRNYAQKCMDWSRNTFTPVGVSLVYSCPCNLWQANQDNRFTLGPDGCYYLTYTTYDYSKVCCYLSQGSWKLRSLTRGNLQFYSAILYEEQWRENDRQPYVDCCVNSDYCSLYNTYRPEDFCSNYTIPVSRYTFGDPHIQSLDGMSYTFNGYGEFELLNIYNVTNSANVLMKIQCRTKEVGINGRKATVFSSFAIRSENVTIQISAREKTQAVKIFGNKIELTAFYTNSGHTWNKGPFYLSANQAENNSYIIRHQSQTIIEISLKESILQFSINIGYTTDNIKTDGILGTYNTNSSDDLTTPKGKIISANSTEEEIYYNFGLLWKVNDSIFHYESGESQAGYQFPSFTPTFLKIDKTSDEYKTAVVICTAKEIDCIYDYLIMKDQKVAENTKEIELKIARNNLLVGLTSPTLIGSKNVTVTVKEKLVHTVEVNADNETLKLDIVERENCNISLLNKEVQISVELTQANPVKAAFQVSNNYNMSTPLYNLTVMVCPYCNNHGSCNRNVINPIRHYEYICKCNKGWRGAHCDIDARCDPLNCLCTGPDDNYTCICPTGYTFLTKCVEIDECKSTATHACSQFCTNTVGSYKCSCGEGYMLFNTTECVNIDECKLNKCEHLCTDTEGSYNCSCYPGYKLNGTTCTKEIDLCNGTIDCSNATGCTIIGGNATCFCKTGYNLNSTTMMCEDIDECASVNCTNGHCQNSEGGYVCKCPLGRKLASDGHTCEECGHNKWGENCAYTCSGANCVECNKTTGCVCSSGYTGTTCQEDIDECQNPDYCNTTLSSCENTHGSAICRCKTGFTVNTSVNCVDIDECDETNLCSASAVCTNTFGSYTCKCNTGYEGDGRNCTDVDECAKNTETCEHTCINQVGSYSCTCQQDYKLQDDRVSCKKDSDSKWTYKERLYIIIIGSVVGAIIAGVLITLWCYYFGCAFCRKRNTFFSTLQNDRYNLRDAFGSLSSTLRGKLNEPLATDSAKASKYLQDWSNFSPYSENNRPETGADNHGWEDIGESSSSWGHIFNHFDNSTEFRIERPKFRP